MQVTRKRRVGVAVAGLALVLAACGSDKKESSDTQAATTTAAAGPPPPQRQELPPPPAARPPRPRRAAPRRAAIRSPRSPPASSARPLTIAYLGALSGDNGNLGKNMINGAQIAFDEFTKANPDCQVKFDTSYDCQGAPEQATGLADTIVGKSDVIALARPGLLR